MHNDNQLNFMCILTPSPPDAQTYPTKFQTGCAKQVSLCECLNDTPYYNRNSRACDSKFRSEWGTSSPSLEQMLDYLSYYCY